MDKEKISEILNSVKEVIKELDEDNQGAMYYLNEIKESAEVLLFSGY